MTKLEMQNELTIANFMGIHKVLQNYRIYEGKIDVEINFHVALRSRLNLGDCYYESNYKAGLKFQTSWDWLMTAFNSFRRLDLSYVKAADVVIYKQFVQEISLAIIQCEINLAFSSLVRGVEFLKGKPYYDNLY